MRISFRNLTILPLFAALPFLTLPLGSALAQEAPSPWVVMAGPGYAAQDTPDARVSVNRVFKNFGNGFEVGASVGLGAFADAAEQVSYDYDGGLIVMLDRQIGLAVGGSVHRPGAVIKLQFAPGFFQWATTGFNPAQ